MSTESIRVVRDGGILRLVLDRPERKNSLTPAAVGVMIDALEAAALDDSLRVLSIESSGPDFCTGADVVAANEGSREDPEDRAGGDEPGGQKAKRPPVGSLQRRTALQAHRLIDLLTSIQRPVVCTVRGWAAGLGFQIALAADFTIAAEDAVFWEPFVARGFTPDSGATWLLPRLIGVARAKALLMLGERIDGRRAAEWGLIFRSVPAGDLEAESEALMARLAASATIAVGLTKKSIHDGLDGGLIEAMSREAFALELSSRTEDFREGLAAFRKRREPGFKGR